MAIITRQVCKCFMCAAEWIPRATKDNPTADPRKVKRCAACKAVRWNDDDPEVAARKAQPRKRTAPSQSAPQDNHAEDAVPCLAATTSRPIICRHRVLLSSCSLCGGAL